MSTVNDLREMILARLDAADTALAHLTVEGPKRMLDAVDVSLVPQGVDAAVRAEIASDIVEVLQRTTAHAGRVLALQRRLVGVAGATDDLDAVAARVAERVSAPARQLAPRLEGSSLAATKGDAWSSNGRYVEAVATQRGALDSVPAAAQTLERALTTMADGIEQYYLTLGSLVTTTTVALLRLATTIATWETAVGGILGITSTFVEVESGLASMHAAALASSRSVDAILSTAADTASAWPRSGTPSGGAAPGA
jgi:hypothetical protein